MIMAGKKGQKNKHTPQQARVAEAVAVAVADDARLHERAAPRHADAAHVVVAQVEVALRPQEQGTHAWLS